MLPGAGHPSSSFELYQGRSMRSDCRSRLCSGLGVILFLCGLCYADQVNLKDYQIVVPGSAIPAEKTAAEELQTHIKEMTGIQVPVVDSNEFAGEKMIAVGFNSKLPAKLSQEHFEESGGKFRPEEILIASDGEILLLAGGRPRGAIYAVYEYLHRLGVRWYSPKYTKIPKLKTFELKQDVYRYNPPVFSRTQASGNAPTHQWSARNRINSYIVWLPIEEKYGGGVGQGPDMHTLTRILSKPVLESHPHWMAMVNGKREKPVTHTWGVCLSNPDLRKYIIERTLDYARKHPERQCIWFGQNDGSDYCQCDKCKAFYKAHGNEPSSLVLQMTNELAERMEKEFPNRIVKTLAYSWSLKPPKNMKVRDNVMIMFCAWGDYDTTLRHNSSKGVVQIRKAIEGWRKIAKRLDVYLYCPPGSYWNARPALLPMCDNIKWAYESGVQSIYVQISGFGGVHGSDLVDLRSWLFARLCWDPSQDANKLIRDFCDGFYGPAGDTVYKGIMAIHADVVDENHLPRKLNNSKNIPNTVDLKKLRQINLSFQRAYNQIKDPIYKKHLSFAWISFLWTDFWAGYEGSGEYSDSSSTWSVPMKDGKLRNHYAKLIKQFMVANGVSALGELKRIAPHTLSIDLMGIPLEAHKIKNDSISAVVVPRIAGRIEDFVDHKTGFKPFKPYWGFLKHQYPLYGSTRDFVNGAFVRAYRFVKREKQSVVMEGRAGGNHVTKTVKLNGNRLEVELKVKPIVGGKLEIRPDVMLDLQDEGFGIYPTVHVEKVGGTWAKTKLGILSDFWYQTGSIDLSNATGRVVITAEKSKRGLLLTFDPKQINKLWYEYDRIDIYPDKGSKMVWIKPISVQNATMGKIYSAKVGWTVLADYEQILGTAK